MDPLQILMAILVFCLMLGLGATLTVNDMKDAVKNWKAPLVGFCSQVLLLPLVAFALAHILDVDNAVGISMVAIGATPGGSTSNLFTYWARGDLPLSIAMTVISNFLSFGTMPALLAIYGPSFMSDDIKIAYKDIVLGLALVLVPVAIGMTVQRRSTYWADWLTSLSSTVGVLFIIAAIIYGSAAKSEMFDADWNTYIGAIGMLPIGAVGGYWLARLSGLSKRQARTVALETGIQNSTLTIAILTLSFEEGALRDRVLTFPLLYSLFLIITAVILTRYWHVTTKEEQFLEFEAHWRAQPITTRAFWRANARGYLAGQGGLEEPGKEVVTVDVAPASSSPKKAVDPTPAEGAAAAPSAEDAGAAEDTKQEEV